MYYMRLMEYTVRDNDTFLTSIREKNDVNIIKMQIFRMLFTFFLQKHNLKSIHSNKRRDNYPYIIL